MDKRAYQRCYFVMNITFLEESNHTHPRKKPGISKPMTEKKPFCYFLRSAAKHLHQANSTLQRKVTLMQRQSIDNKGQLNTISNVKLFKCCRQVRFNSALT